MKIHKYLLSVYNASTIFLKRATTIVAMLCFLLFGNTTSIMAQLASCHSKFVGNIWYDGNMPLNFDQYFNQLTPENATKWSSVQGGGPNSWNWGQALNMYNYCKSNGLPFKYHTLVWGNQYPSWVDNASDKAAAVENWIREAGQTFPNSDFVDVVNECLPNHAQPSWLGDIGGQNGLYGTGWDWVVWSFEKARQYFPNSKLLINDYNILNNSWNNDLDVLCQIVNILNDRGLIDGIGLQSHGLQNTPGADVTARLNSITSQCPGVPIYISEFDLDIADDTQQRNKMAELFPIFWSNAAIQGITFWGYVQGRTWIPNSHLIRSDGSERPAMVWLKDYLSCSGCIPSTITPYVQINGGSWQQTASASLNTGDNVMFGPQPVSGGSWSWSGPNGFTASTREVTISNIQANQAGDYVATYTNDGGCLSTQTFTVTVTGSGGNPTSVHVQSILTGTQNAGKGNKRGTATVTIFNDLGTAVSGATVTGTFSGSFNETISGTTDSNGAVTLITNGTAKGGVTVNLCVDNVTHSSLTYASAQNVITCTGAGARFSVSQMDSRATEKEEEMNFVIYPNPSSGGKFTVVLPEIAGKATVSIFDGQGKLRYERAFNNGGRLDIDSGLKSGIYIVNARSEGMTFTKKLMIQ